MKETSASWSAHLSAKGKSYPKQQPRVLPKASDLSVRRIQAGEVNGFFTVCFPDGAGYPACPATLPARTPGKGTSPVLGAAAALQNRRTGILQPPGCCPGRLREQSADLAASPGCCRGGCGQPRPDPPPVPGGGRRNAPPGGPRGRRGSTNSTRTAPRRIKSNPI